MGITVLHKLMNSILPWDNKGIVFKTVTAYRFAEEIIKITCASPRASEIVYGRYFRVLLLLIIDILFEQEIHGLIKSLIDWLYDSFISIVITHVICSYFS